MYIKVSKIHTLYYRIFGSKKNPLIIYLHGGPGGYHMPEMKEYIDLSRYCFLTFDQRGCGKSQPFLEKRENSIKETLEDIGLFIKKYGNNKPVILIGDSYGTQLAILYTLKYPEQIKKNILTGLWLGTKKEVNSLYFGKSKKYSDIFYKIYSKQRINLKEEHEKIQNNQSINSWIIWEYFLNHSNKNRFMKQINKNINFIPISKEDKGIAFFESFFFSQKSYYKYALSYKNLLKIKDKIVIFNGSLDEVCLPLQKKFLNRNKIKYNIIKNMGHMPTSKKHHCQIFKEIKHD